MCLYGAKRIGLFPIAVSLVFILSNTPLHASDLTFKQMFSSNFPGFPRLLAKTGKITFLRVSTPQDSWGPTDMAVKAEVIIKLDSDHEDRALGFQLRNDKHLPANQAMLQLLLEAYRNNWAVTVDATIPFIRHQVGDGSGPVDIEARVGYIHRVFVKKETQARTGWWFFR